MKGSKPELSVILPFCQEWPQLVFTVASIAEELRDRVDFEIIAINNWCKELEAQLKAQGKGPDRGLDHLDAVARGQPWLRSLKYEKKLSHWQCKNLGVENSSGKFLWFCDAHCIVSRDALVKMFEYYREHHEELNGTLHLPLTYAILEWRKLIYKLALDLPQGHVHYSFTRYRDAEKPYKVPCMSTCGMMMTRELFDAVGGWPKELGIYGGGENFMNFTLAVLGKSINIMPGEPLRHHGDKRGYYWNNDDFVRNRCIANYMFGGRDLARKFVDGRKGSPRVLNAIYMDVLDKCEVQREMIKAKQVISIEDWIVSATKGNI